MSEPFIGEIRMFAGNFAPRGWALCDGQLLAISQHDALFSLLGTIYGGDGRTSFALPEMRGRLPIHAGTGPGLSSRLLGSRAGDENVTVVENELPPHNHGLQVSTAPGELQKPIDMYLASSPTVRMYRPTPSTVNLDAAMVNNTGGSAPHTNVMPFTCVNFIITLVGIYPSRT